MTSVFRFVAARKSRMADPAKPVPLLQDTPFVRDLSESRSSLEQLGQIAAAFIDGPEFVASTADLASYAEIRSVVALLRSDGDPRELLRRLREVFPAPIEEIVKTESFLQQKRRLSDSIVAIKILQSSHPDLLSELRDLFLGFAFLDSVARDRLPEEPGSFLGRALLLPGEVFPLGLGGGEAPPSSDNGPVAHPKDLEPTLEPLGDRSLHERAIEQLMSLGAVDFEPGSKSEEGAVSLRVRQTSMERIDSDVRELLAARRLDPTEQSADSVVRALSRRMLAIPVSVDAERTAVRSIGSTFLPHQAAPAPLVGQATGATSGAPGVPTTAGSVRGVGVGDLLIVREQLVRYEAADVAHIENVLRGEGKTRTHRSLDKTEETITSEVELTTEEARELETTDRFELQRETSKVIGDTSSTEFGVGLSASYGPLVQVDTDFSAASSSSKEESTQAASTFAQDVTERASSQIAERILESSTVTVISEVEETNVHELDNKDGADHTVGVYQWVNKVYNEQIYNYGLRYLFDFMIAEPAAFTIHSMLNAALAEGELIQPEEFTLLPSDLNASNYMIYVDRYDVASATPPPDYFLYRSYESKGTDPEVAPPSIIDSAKVEIPEGYEAVSADVVVLANVFTDEEWSLSVSAADEFDTEKTYARYVTTFTLNEFTGEIPVQVRTAKVSTFTISFLVKCRRTAELYDAWKLETHAAIKEAYLAKQADYEQKLAAAKVSEGIKIVGSSPEKNRALEIQELKRNCVSLITGQHFEMFNAIQVSSPEGYPELDLSENEVEGAYARFFENAFEWQNMTYVFYPYYWARKATWLESLQIEDADPLFEEFLKAGTCRVVVPVRPGFERSIVNFLDTGQVWSGGDLPDISSPLYLDILDEIMEATAAPGEEVPEGDPWEAVVPTNLVILRSSDDLPAWEQDADGVWRPVAPTSS